MAYDYKSVLFNYNSNHKWIQAYINFIERCKNRKWKQSDGPFELHHIVPKSWGGLDCNENIIKLPILHHIIAHCYLYHTRDVHMMHAFSHMFVTRNLDFQNNYFINAAAKCRKLVTENRGRKIVNLSTGKTFSSIRDAVKHYNLKCTSTIRYAIDHYLSISSTGHYWQYEDCITERTYDEEIEKIKQLRVALNIERKQQKILSHQKTAQAHKKQIINLTTNVVYDSIVQACNQLNVAQGSILDAIRHHTKVNSCYWMYYDEYDSKLGVAYYISQFDQIAQSRMFNKQSCVIDITTNTKYASIRDAARAMHVNPNAITSAINTKGLCCGRKWIRENNNKRDFRVVELNTMRIFSTKKQASEETGISKNSIARSTFTNKPVKGTLWKNFVDLDPQLQKQFYDRLSIDTSR